MPRKYIPDPKKKRRSQPDPNIIACALKDVKKGLSFRKAAEKHDIDYSVLYRHAKASPGEMKSMGGQTALTRDVELMLVDRIITCSKWGYPLDSIDVCMLIKSYLDVKELVVRQFKNNMPGRDFIRSFLERHKDALSERTCQNIKRSRSLISKEIINQYFDELEVSLQDIPPANILNYDETNLSDDPGKKKILTKRGTKYPERIMNHSKTATSIMYAAAGDGTVLPPYVVYKSLHMYISWHSGGPKGARYNRSKSGWFDATCFSDWVHSVAVPYFRRLTGRKVLIGDNLASHLSPNVIKTCEDMDISFVFLPPNSTHLTQPLDVSFFRPLKGAWRKILAEWKKGPGRKEATIPKDVFPRLLGKLTKAIEPNQAQNVKKGFEKCGIIPIDRQKILSVLPDYEDTLVPVDVNVLDNSVITLLKGMRYDGGKPRVQRKKVTVIPGKSVAGIDFESSEDEPMEASDIEDVSPSCSSEEEESVSEVRVEDRYLIGRRTVSDAVPPVFRRNGRVMKGLSAVSEETQIKCGDWLLVNFSGSSKSGSSSEKHSLYIGQVMILRKDEEDYEAEFLRLKPTKEDMGSVFVKPSVDDFSTFSFNQVVGKLEPPISLRRGNYKFSVNALDW